MKSDVRYVRARKTYFRFCLMGSKGKISFDKMKEMFYNFFFFTK